MASGHMPKQGTNFYRALNSVKTKIYLTPGIILLLFGLVALLMQFGSNQALQTFSRVEELQFPTSITSSTARAELMTMLININKFLETDNEQFISEYQLSRTRFEILLEELQTLSTNWTDPENIARLQTLKTTYDNWIKLPDRIFELHGDPLQNNSVLRILEEEVNPHYITVDDGIAELIYVQAARSPSRVNTTILLAMADFQASWSPAYAEMQHAIATVNPSREDYDSFILANSDALSRIEFYRSELTTRQSNLVDRIIAARDSYMLFPDAIFMEVAGGEIREDRRILTTELTPIATEMLDMLAEMVLDQQNLLFNDITDGKSILSNIQQQNLIIGIIAVIISIGISYVVSSRLIQSISKLTEATEAIAAGDLSHRIQIDTQDEIGVLASAFNRMAENLESSNEGLVAKGYLEDVISQYQVFVQHVTNGDLTGELVLNDNKTYQQSDYDDLHQLGANLVRMVENLSRMAQQIRESASSVVAASTQIQAATAQQLASATEQDASVSQTATTVSEVRATVLQTAERAQSVADAATKSVEVSQRGEAAVNDTVDGMTMIRQRVENIAETILVLSERTQQIGEIIETVKGLADQSKLLALNASIEAARTGVEGRGFAVVAMEVRELAEQSRQATTRINDILSEIQQATNTAVMATEEGSKEAERGMELVTNAGEAIRNLADTLAEVTQSAAQIAASTHQQTNGMDQLSIAMTQIQQASTQVAVSTRQAEQSARDLTVTAKLLEEAASQYKLDN